MKMDAQALLITILIGLVAGFLASVVVGGSGGLIKFLVSGLIGSFESVVREAMTLKIVPSASTVTAALRLDCASTPTKPNAKTKISP